MRRWRLLTALALVLAAPAGALAQSAAATPLRGPELLVALRAGGYILYFRHADTDHSQNDQRMTSVEDCATQRERAPALLRSRPRRANAPAPRASGRVRV